MRSILLAASAALVLLPSVAAAQSMNAEVFHKRATALMKKGPLALFSRGEIKALMAEGQAAGLKARDQRLAAVKAGGQGRYCPPPGPQSMNSDEFMKRLAAIPPAERARINMTEATTRVLASKFPCKA
ncbi:MAG: hypothetical protein AVDCRST_MAG62-634 [uncultured Sphingomonas sp.]|jgi:hypothetical protein|uniref:Rap1a immunity protein domain-containing protein n=1 Tax=uncultured Sphingomonas sp. TaxID=158754 RepID=A0A6J4T406_9SPHN|nr:MAG: hypothetical protein AVDCRST_MAG62-634 [uncultured Sphingomonas sp.]